MTTQTHTHTHTPCRTRNLATNCDTLAHFGGIHWPVSCDAAAGGGGSGRHPTRGGLNRERNHKKKMWPRKIYKSYNYALWRDPADPQQQRQQRRRRIINKLRVLCESVCRLVVICASLRADEIFVDGYWEQIRLYICTRIYIVQSYYRVTRDWNYKNAEILRQNS